MDRRQIRNVDSLIFQRLFVTLLQPRDPVPEWQCEMGPQRFDIHDLETRSLHSALDVDHGVELAIREDVAIDEVSRTCLPPAFQVGGGPVVEELPDMARDRGSRRTRTGVGRPMLRTAAFCGCATAFTAFIVTAFFAHGHLDKR